MSADTQAQSSVRKPMLGQRARRRALMVAAIALAGIATAWWLYQRYTHVFSEDARIATSMIEVSAKVAGQVVEFPVSQGDELMAGAHTNRKSYL